MALLGFLNDIKLIELWGIDVEFKPQNNKARKEFYIKLVDYGHTYLPKSEGEYYLKKAVSVYEKHWLSYAILADYYLTSNSKLSTEYYEKAKQLYQEEYGIRAESDTEMNEVMLSLLLSKNDLKGALNYAREASNINKFDLTTMKVRVILESIYINELKEESLRQLKSDILYLEPDKDKIFNDKVISTLLWVTNEALENLSRNDGEKRTPIPTGNNSLQTILKRVTKRNKKKKRFKSKVEILRPELITDY